MKLKLQSPLTKNMVIELANGGDGYIPPPEQHFLGGYNTWAARSAGLEVAAEPKITESALRLLEQVAGRNRREFIQSRGPGSRAILDARPVAYWRLDELAGPRALDSSGHDRDAIYEPGVVFFLQGPRPQMFCRGGELNRAAHFAGGRLQARSPDWAGTTPWWSGSGTACRPMRAISADGCSHVAAIMDPGPKAITWVWGAPVTEAGSFSWAPGMATLTSWMPDARRLNVGVGTRPCSFAMVTVYASI